MRKIETYQEIRKHLEAFSQGKINLLFIVSRGGLGKSTMAEEALIEQAPLIIKGHITPLQLYKTLYLKNEEEKEFLTVLDDIDGLLSNKMNVALLKQICETQKDKLVHYYSTSHLLKGFEQKFETSCKVLILLNDISVLSENKSLKALLSRAQLIDFNPSTPEIIKYMMKYIKDKKLIEFIEKYSRFSNDLNLRTYERAKELKEANLNWEKEIISSLNIDENLYAIDNLMKKYKKDEDRLKNFEGSRTTFYRYKKKYLEKVKK